MAHTKRLKCTILAGSFPRLCAVRRKTRTQRWHSHRRTCLKLKLAAGVPSQCAEVPGSADDTKQVHSKRSLRLTRSGCAILGSDVRIMQIIHITHHTHAHAHASISYLSTASCSRVPTSRKLFFGNVSVCHLSVCVCANKSGEDRERKPEGNLTLNEGIWKETRRKLRKELDIYPVFRVMILRCAWPQIILETKTQQPKKKDSKNVVVSVRS